MELTVMVVKNVRVAVAENALATRSIGISIRPIDESTATLDEILAILVIKWTTDTLGPSDTNAVSSGLSVFKAKSHDMGRANVLGSRRRQIVRVQVAAETMAEPEVVPSIMPGDKCALDGMGSSGIATNRVGKTVRQCHRLWLPGELARIRLSSALRRNQILAERNLVDALPVTSVGQVGLTVWSHHRAGIDCVGHGVGFDIGSITCACLDDHAVVIPTARSWGVRRSNTDGAVTATRLADTVVEVVCPVNGNHGRCPGCSTITLGDNTVGVEYIADHFPRASDARGRMDEHMLSNLVQVVLIADPEDGRVMSLLLSLASRREASDLVAGKIGSLILVEARTEHHRKKTYQAKDKQHFDPTSRN